MPTPFALLLLLLPLLVHTVRLPRGGHSRTRPPHGAVVVRQNTTLPKEFGTISAAVNSLPADNSTRSIFIYPGTYLEQVNITRAGPLTIYGYTTDTRSFEHNVVTLSHASSLATAGSDDLTGTLRIHKDDFSMYNVDVRNTFGSSPTNGQAIAISAYGNRMGLYASRFFSFQDTLYANQGTQVYAKSYIEGAVDFIFGREGQAYFEGNTIASISAGCITANGRETNDSGIYILNRNTLVLGPNAAPSTSGNVFLGRPWGDYARVVFKNTYIGSHLNRALWSIWDPGDNRTDHVLFGTFEDMGPGVINDTLPDFATALTREGAENYTIATALGVDYADWVDIGYITGEL
ncbi:carbohydrate esterase family 8 protein [Ramaria rubella]|nr:carbohydrate esterase family 8 protein [Ramaria rubella]